MIPSHPPLDDFDRDRLRRRDVALGRISRLNRWWLGGQLATAAALCMGSAGIALGSSLASLPMIAALLLSVAAAGGSAGVALWNWYVLPGVWRVVGLAPWAILMTEATVVVLGIA